MLSFVTTCKPFEGQFEVIQLNAIRSWLRFCPPCEIIILGNSRGSERIAEKYNLKYIPEVPTNEYGTPLLSGLVRVGSQNAKFDNICLINSDIVILDIDLIKLKRLLKLKSFIITAKRINVKIFDLLDFNDIKTYDKLEELAKGSVPKGNDLFIYKRGTIEQYVIPLAIGRGDHARFFIYLGLKRKMPVIDATSIIRVLHQDHDYSHIPYSSRPIKRGIELANTPEGRYNERLCPIASYFGGDDCNYVVTLDGNLIPRADLKGILRRGLKTLLLSDTAPHILKWFSMTQPQYFRIALKHALYKSKLFYT